jgi:hypothetical protein
MSCNDKKKFKTSEASTKASLRTKGAIDKFLNILDYNLFNNLNNKWTDDARQRFNIKGKLFYEEDNKAIANKEAFRKIDNAKGIFYQLDTTQPLSVAIKPGVEELFESNPELSSIGTQEQYSQYLDTIFPESKVKDIVYHGVIKGREAYNNILKKGFDFKTPRNWDSKKSKFLENDNTGMFFSDRSTGQSYGLELTYKVNEKGEYEDVAYDNTIPALLDVQYLDTTKATSSGTAARFYRENKDKSKIGMYGIEGGSEGEHYNYVVFEPEQIHILGSKQDIEGFKKFVNNSQSLPVQQPIGTQTSSVPLKQKFDAQLNKTLINFIKGLNVDVQFNQDDLLKFLEFNNTPLSAFDTLQKFLALGSNITDKDFKKQTANIIYTFLGKKSELSLNLWKSIDRWSGYEEIYNKYDTQQTRQEEVVSEDIEFSRENFNPFAHRQAIIEYIAQALELGIDRNFKPINLENPDISKEYFEKLGHKNIYEQNGFIRLLNKLYNWIQEKILNNKIEFVKKEEELKNIVMDIVNDIYENDYKKFIRKYIKEEDGVIRDISTGEVFEQKFYQETLNKDPYAKSIIEKLFKNPFIDYKLSGSQVVRKYGALFRSMSEDLHDIDGVITLEQFSKEANASTFLNWLRTEGIRLNKQINKKPFTKKAEKFLEEQNWYQNVKNSFPTWKLTNVFIGRDHSKAESLTITGYVEHPTETEILDGIVQPKRYILDFFLRTGEGNYPEIFDNYWKDWKQIFEAKVNMGRAKDINDLIYFEPFKTDKYKFTNKGFRYFTFAENITPDSALQSEDIPFQSVTSPAIIAKVKEVIKKMGVNLQDLSEYAKNNPNINVSSINALADLVSGIIAVSEGREDVALTEEMVHIATAIIEQKNPRLITEMISKIGRFKIYKDTLEAYKDIPAYQLPNGKPDIRKIKKEAVDKLIAEIIMQDGSLSESMTETDISIFRKIWNTITDWFRGQYKKANIDVFSETAKTVIGGEFEGSVLDLTSEEVYYQVSDKQKEFQRLIQETGNFLRKNPQEESVDPILLDEEDATNFYEYLTNGEWKRVKNRVTDEVKAWYNQRFRGKTFTELEKRDNEVKRELGTKYHRYFEEIYARFFNTDGTRRTTSGERPVIENSVDDQVYTKLEKYFTDLIADFSKDGKKPLVFSEVKIYDPVKDQAGTIDLLIVEEDGTANIYDWKFMSVAKDAKDIAWYKQGAYNEQLTRYGEILKDFYDIDNIRKNRAIPIIMDLQRENPQDLNTQLQIKKIEIGSVNPKKLESLALTPLSQREETTGIKELDELVNRLNVIYDKISKKKVKEDDRLFKKERLNILREAIRSAQGQFNLGPLTDVINIIRKEGENIRAEWENNYKNRPAKDPSITQQELDDFSKQLILYKDISEVFGRIDDKIGHLIYVPGQEKITPEANKENIEFRKEKLLALSEATKSIRLSREEVLKITGDFGDKFQGLRNNVTGLLSPTAVIRGLASTFRTLSEIDLPSLKILSRLALNAQNNAAQDSLVTVNRIMAIRQRLIDRGGNVKETLKKIYQKDDKGGLVNLLIQRYDKKFYDEVKSNAAEGLRSKQWLIENIDIKAYMDEAKRKIDKSIEYYEKTMPDETIQASAIKDVKERYDINNPNFKGWDNEIVKRHPLAKWESKEYLEIKKDADLFELYELITEMNNKASEIGYIQNRVQSVFLPFVRKSMAEGIAWGTGPNALMNFSSALTRQADDVGYGSIDELTGELDNSIPKYYTTDITEEVGGVENLSLELFKNLILYSNQLEKYKYMSEIEGQLQLVKTVMQSKDHYKTSWFGNVDKNQIQTGNQDNAKIYDEFLQTVLYGVKYAGDPSDFGIPAKGIAKTLNSIVKPVLGRDVFDGEETNISLVKSMDALNKAFQLKTLGLEPISGAVNAFGGVLQIATQAGNYFKARELYSSVKQLISNRFKGEEDREKFIQMVDLFMPLKDDPTYDKLQEAGLTKLTRQNFSDILFAFFRQPEQVIEKSLFLTFLNNMMVEDGKIVSIREFVKNKYKDRYDSSSKFREVKSKIENEIEQLKKTSSINVTSKIENGKLVIPGLDLNNREEIQRLTNLTRTIARNATGGYTAVETMRANMNIWTKSMMVFKGWIPKLVDTRFGEFRKVSDDFSVRLEDDMLVGEKYDIGRIRLFSSFLHFNILKTVKEITDIIPFSGEINDDGLAKLDEMFIKYSNQYEQRTGQKLNMTREEFIDLIRNNLRNQVKELSILMVLFGSLFSLGFFEPEDDDDKATKNFFRYSQRTVNRFIDELMFFYNPAEWEGILSNGMIPSLGLFADIRRFTNHFFMETTGIDRSDFSKSEDKVRKEAQPIKYAMRMFPFTKSLVTWLAIIDSDFAKDFDVTISKTPR